MLEDSRSKKEMYQNELNNKSKELEGNKKSLSDLDKI